jgi:hypothetical protein
MDVSALPVATRRPSGLNRAQRAMFCRTSSSPRPYLQCSVQKSETRTNKTRMRILREYSESVIVRTYLIPELFLLCKEG